MSFDFKNSKILTPVLVILVLNTVIMQLLRINPASWIIAYGIIILEVLYIVKKTDLLKINNFIPASITSTSIVYLYTGIALNKATPSFFKWLLFVICLVLYTKGNSE